MKTSRMFKIFALAFLLIMLLGSAFPVSAHAVARPDVSPQLTAEPSFNCTYVVRPGDYLIRIALRFGTTPSTLAFVNGIANPNFIFVGMVLRVPCTSTTPPPPPSGICSFYVVQRGDWLNLIAARFGVTWQSITALNHLANPSLIFPGMRLAIPCRSGAADIIITLPASGQGVCTPVNVSGSVRVSPFEATLRGRVYNAPGAVVGEGPIHVNAEMGQPGNFSGQISFDTTRVTNGSPGRVELANISARDGSVISSVSVPVTFSCGG